VSPAGYRGLLKYPFFLYTWNSLVVATGCTVLGLAVGLPAASRSPTGDSSVGRGHPGRPDHSGIAYLILVHLLSLPDGRHLRRAHPHAPHRGPAHHHLGHDLFFEDVPPDLEDAGLIDGCSHFGVFWRIALPLVKLAWSRRESCPSCSPGTTSSSR
jgi:hypothetical protein